MKTQLLGLLFPACLFATAAFADDKAACLDAASKGQRLKDDHKLVEAREQLVICAAATCPAVVQTDCAGWVAEVDRALPGVIVSAKDAAGTDLSDVKVTVDGRPFVSVLDGQARPMNAGRYTFHFESAAGSMDEQVVVVEGDKNQHVAVVLKSDARSLPPAASPAPASGAPPTPSAESEATQGSSSPWRTVGWVLGGVGLAGLGVGTVFGIIALNDKNNADCNASNVCNPGASAGIKSMSLVSDIGWVAGGVLLGGGAALVLFAPSGSSGATTAVQIAPTVTIGGAGLLAGGRW